MQTVDAGKKANKPPQRAIQPKKKAFAQTLF
jgi:hypothetical protein